MVNFVDFIAELQKDLESLSSAVYRLAHIDNIFWQMQAIFKECPSLVLYGNTFQNWMASCYVDSIAVGLRRLGDKDKRTRSLFRILEKMKPRAHEFSRSWYVNRYPAELQLRAHDEFSELVGDKLDTLTKDVLVRQQEALKASLKIVSDYTNQFVAHSDMEPVAQVPTFTEAREAIANTFVVIRWLSLLIDSASILSAVPVSQTNWLQIFRVPWLAPGQAPPAYVHLDTIVEQRRKNKK